MPEERADRRASFKASSTARDLAGELDFKDGEGVVAPLFPDEARASCRGAKGAAPRCLLSVVDRTVEVQAERDAARRDAARQPDRPAQPPGFTEAIEKAGEKVARDLEHAVLVVDMLRFSPDQRNAWAALPATSC